jgi:hypothetical protein
MSDIEKKDAAEKALDEIARVSGCPEWDYPGQVVRDVQALAAENAKLKEALIWCSGASDFAPEGRAREGWLRMCKPLIG